MTAIPLVKPVTTGCGMNLITEPSFDDTDDDEDHAGHERRDDEAVDAELLHDAVDDDDERAGRSADLDARAAERRDEEAGDDRGVEPAIRRDAAGDRERDGEWERDDADDHSGGEVGEELRAIVGLERRDELRNEHWDFNQSDRIDVEPAFNKNIRSCGRLVNGSDRWSFARRLLRSHFRWMQLTVREAAAIWG